MEQKIEMAEQCSDIASEVEMHNGQSQEENRLHRGLKSRHIAMIAIGGAVGTGLLIGTGAALARAGPASVFIAYTFVGFLVYLVMTALAEMAAWLPLPSGFTGYAVRFCDPGLGFALGYLFWFKYIILTPNQLTAGALVIQYWVPREQINPGVFIAIFWVTIVVINLFGVRFFGEFEFWLSSFKVIVIVGLLILSLVLAVGGGPDHQVHGFRYWEDPGAFAEYIDTGAKGRFLAFWSVMIFATYAYLGTELVGVTAGEAQNPRRTIPRAIKLTFYRILVFYCLGVLLLGMLLPYNSPELAFASTSKSGSASASPFVVAIKLAGIQALPGILNACILVFVFSQANSDLYIGSRTLYGLAREGKAPAIFGRTNAAGVPVYALAATAAVALLAFMNVADDSTRVFGYFVNMNTIFGLLTWISILVTHVGFVRARRAQNVPDTALAYVAPLGVRGSYAALACCIVIALTKNFTVFIRHRNSDGSVEAFDYRGFITGYIGIPLYLLFIFGYKFWTKSPGVNPHQADLWTGKDVIDREEEEFLAQQAAREMERVKAGKKALADNWWYRTFVAPLF